MTYSPNFKDFYRRTVVPMGSGRKQFLEAFSNGEDDIEELTHWFVAIEGSLKTSEPEYFQWKVLVFPSREDGSYYRFLPPYYQSEYFDTIEESFIHSSKIIESLKEGKPPLYKAG